MTSDRSQLEYFNQIAEHWARIGAPDPDVLKALWPQEEAGTHTAILDAGCGAGHLLGHLLATLKADGCLVALDPARRMLAAALRTHPDPRIRGRCATLDAYGGEDGPFDRIVFCRVLHHLPDPGRALHRAAGWLRPGGAVWILQQTSGDEPKTTPVPDSVDGLVFQQPVTFRDWTFQSAVSGFRSQDDQSV